MAARPQQTLTATNTNSKHSALLADSASSATLPSPHLSHYQGGKLGCSSDLDGRDGNSGHHITRPSVSHPNFSSSSSAFLSSSTSVVPFPLSSLSLSSSLSPPPSNHNQTPRPASRRTARPCSLCGTSTHRPQPTYLPTPAFGVLEQPIVLLHRLEDGLPRGDVKSLHAFGTIRLLPVQSTDGQANASDNSYDENTGHNNGESQIGLAMEDATEGSTQKVLYNHSSTSEYENDATYSDGDSSNERLEESDTENGVESVFLEESYPLEAIVESEVAVVSNHCEWNNKLYIRENGCGFKIQSVKKSDVNNYCIKNSECGDKTDRVESVRDQCVKSDKKKLSNINRSSINALLTGQGSESGKELLRNSSVAKPDSAPSVLQQSCDKIKENYFPKNKQSLSVNNFSVPSTKCPSTLSTDCVSTTSVKALPGFISPSCTVPTPCSQTTLTTKPFARQCSSSTVQSSPDSFIAYSPKMRHSPVAWSPHRASPNICESPALISNYCPSSDISSPAPSPPSPCESPSLPFSPPPSPAPEVIQSRTVEALGKGESQSFPLSPYSPGSSPSSPIYPAPPLSPSDSPPSPTASADSLLTSHEGSYATPVEQNDMMEDTSEMRGLPCTPSESGDNCASSRLSLMISDSCDVTTETNAQVEFQLGVNDELKSTHIKSLENSVSVASLDQSENFASDESEADIKSSLEDCSSSSEEKKSVYTENDPNSMKLKVRIRSKTDASLAVQKFSNEECNKNGIPKIVLTLKGSGPNKEYSCSNKLRNDSHPSSNDDVTYRKHKSKKDRKERERHKVRNTPKRNKYKRHLELFGEDSNDSLKLESCDNNGISSKCNDASRDAEKSKGTESPVLFSSLRKSDYKSDDELILPIKKPQYSFSENIQIYCESVKHPSAEEKCIKEDSFSDDLPDLEPVPIPEDNDEVLRICKTRVHVKQEVVQAKIPAFKKKEIKFQRSTAKRGVLAKKRLLMSKKKQRRTFLRNIHSKNEVKSSEIKNKLNIKEKSEGGHTDSDCISNVNQSKAQEDHLPRRKSTELFNVEEKISDPVPSESSLTTQEKVSIDKDDLSQDAKVQQIQDTLSKLKGEIDTKCENDHSSQVKQEGSYLRAQPERTTKKCEAGRDSDSCLWVSFGVNRPVPLPASDLPSLAPEIKVEGTVKLECEDNAEVKKEIHDSVSPTPNPQQTSVSIPQVDDSNTDINELASSVADPRNPLPIPSTDQAATQYFDEPLCKKAKYSKADDVINNIVSEEMKSAGTTGNSPDLPPATLLISVKENVVMPHIRLRSAPRLTSKATEESRGNLQRSDDAPKCAKVSRKDIGDKTQKLESCNSSHSISHLSGNSNSDVIKDKLKDSEIGPLNSVNAIISRKLEAEDGQYYRPKKIQKVSNEIVQKLPCEKSQSDVLFPEETDLEKTAANSYQYTEGKIIHSSASRDSSCEDEQKGRDEIISSETPTSASRQDRETPESNLLNCDRGNLVDTNETEENDNVIIPPPHDPEFDKVWAGRPRKKWKNRRRKQSAKSDLEDGVLPPDKSQESLTKDCSTSCKDPAAPKNIKSTKKDKEATKKPRKSRKKDESGPGVGKTSAFEALQQTFEVKHVEERGRRLAQEIKGFNWLEEKIKNSSLNRTGSSPSVSPARRPPPPLVPRTSPVLVVAPPSLTTSTPPSPSTLVKRKEEFPTRRNSFTGCSTTGGLKGHLQTAVPPLLPSFRRTALPKHSKLSSPCSSVSESGGSVVMSTVASSSNSVLIQENPSTNMGVKYGPIAVSETATLLQENGPTSFPDSDRATLYSSTDSNTATLYGVSNPHLEVLFKDAETVSDRLCKKNSDPSQRNISLSFPQLPPVPELKMTSHCTSTTSVLARDGHSINSQDKQCSTTVVSNSNPRVSTGSGSPQRTSPVFSQKHILLKRAFMDMMKGSEKIQETTQDANMKISSKDKPLEASQAVSSGEESKDLSAVKTIQSHVSQDGKDTSNQEDKVQQLPKICEEPIKKEEEKVFDAVSDSVKKTLMKSISKTDSTESETKSGEMHSAILFSMLYEELQRTRQEVERLRKQQEMMLTEKSDKVEETDIKNEHLLKDETLNKNRPQSQKSSSVGNQSDDDSVEICEEKPAKISIRSDLLATCSQASITDKVSIHTTQVSTAVTCSNISPKPSVSIPDRQLISPSVRSSSMLSQMSPKSNQTSPCPSQMSPSLSRNSPVVNPFVTQVSHHLSYPSPVQTAAVSTVQSTLPLPHTSPTPSHINVVSLYSSSGTLKSSPVLPRNSPVISRQSPCSSNSPTVPKSSPALPKSSPVAPLCSPRASKDNTLDDINPENLRSKYGINTEVEVMPVPNCGKMQYSEPQPHTYLEVIEYQKPQDTPLLLEAVKGRRTENNTINERERVLAQSSLAQHLIGDHVKRPMYSQAVDNEMKRSRFSTSDLPEFPPSSEKPPPPLKPVTALQRRYSDNMDSRKPEPIIVSFPPPNNGPGFPSTSEHGNSALSFPQPRSSVTQNAILPPHMRRCTDVNNDRIRDYQHQFNLQHQQYQPQIRPCIRTPALRSLGPDKATIFPIPAPSSSGIQPYGKSHTPPTARSSVMEQHKVSLVEPSGVGIFPKPNIQSSFDSQITGATNQERLQPSSGPFEKTRQPQTFAARVLVRDSVPETVPRLPPPSYQSQHYSNCNPHLSSVMPNHPYMNNMHLTPGANLHHMVTEGLIRGSLQPSSTNILSHNSSPRINTSSGSSERKRCLNCPQPAKFLCSGCKKAWYCSENCQREHWVIHNTSCVA
ncbi:streptococcal hemagglutinin-like isoform X2 [Palaemon carinicauda]|uniref:streptococcal hemagglutinin-like isoform X2 n=1 Tax=Palaemon carinicauda TaxID=392227 RepID=UPI0035B5DA05